MLQDILMLAALFILRIGVPLLLVVGIGYTLLQKVTGIKLDWSPKFVIGVGLVLALWALAVIALILRLTNGMGAVTNLTDEFPLGMWIGFDVMAGRHAGRRRIRAGRAGLRLWPGALPAHPALHDPDRLPGLCVAGRGAADRRRPALQYMLAGRCIYRNIHSVLWEVAMCVMCYTTVLALEFRRRCSNGCAGSGPGRSRTRSPCRW